MWNEILSTLPYLSMIVTIMLAVGTFRQSHNKAALEVQDQVINALKTQNETTISALKIQNETQAIQIKEHEKEIRRLNGVVKTIQIALKRRGFKIEIDSDVITLVDTRAKRDSTVQIQIDENSEETTHDSV